MNTKSKFINADGTFNTNKYVADLNAKRAAYVEAVEEGLRMGFFALDESPVGRPSEMARLRFHLRDVEQEIAEAAKKED
jgi:hypothetical protein